MRPPWPGLVLCAVAAGGGDLPGPPKKALQWEWVDEANRISIAKAFISKAERDYLLEFIQTGAGGWAPSVTVPPPPPPPPHRLPTPPSLCTQ